MRTCILGIWDWQNAAAVRSNTECVCRLTHFDPRCVGSCVIATHIIDCELLGTPLSEEEVARLRASVEEGERTYALVLNTKKMGDEDFLARFPKVIPHPDVPHAFLYRKSDYEFGKSTWSWIVWQDASCNYDDQKTYIDFASELGYPYCLIDAFWDQNIGRDRIEELSRYARSKGVSLFLWYASSGWWNDISQSPVHIMSDPIARKKEMRWLESIGVKGIKVDFFGGDKQETMRIYESILSDADDCGIMVIFHGCTLPRGWERMYPNYVGSEAVRASENLVFSQYECDIEAVNATLHPFIRNSVGCMEFGGTFLNKRLNRANGQPDARGRIGGTERKTSDAFQLATAVLFQNPIQNFALTPNNLEDAPAAAIEFMREVPTTWDETRYIAGTPSKDAVIARRCGSTWYVGAVNAEEAAPRQSTPTRDSS